MCMCVIYTCIFIKILDFLLQAYGLIGRPIYTYKIQNSFIRLWANKRIELHVVQFIPWAYQRVFEFCTMGNNAGLYGITPVIGTLSALYRKNTFFRPWSYK